MWHGEERRPGKNLILAAMIFAVSMTFIETAIVAIRSVRANEEPANRWRERLPWWRMAARRGLTA